MATHHEQNGLEATGTKPMTLTILGCGALGTAILVGVLASLTEMHSSVSSSTNPDAGSANSIKRTSGDTNPPPRVPSKFIACVRGPGSAKRIEKAVSVYPEAKSVTVLQNENIQGVSEANVVILGCKPYMVKDMLNNDKMREALSGKLLISICAGVPVDQLSDSLYGVPYAELATSNVKNPATLCRVMPNTAAVVRESMTVIAISQPALPKEFEQLTSWIFSRIGRVATLPASVMDASTALCGSGPAFCALMMESLADGAVAMGLPRAEAQLMAAQTMRGTAAMVLAGEHPALVREKVSTPGGCTIGGLLVLEEGCVRGTVSRAVREATVVASELGKGVTGVNGTRFR